MFHELVHNFVEVYVDDILANYKNNKYHIMNLIMIFERFINYKLILKPKKSAFGISYGKFIGFIVSRSE